MKNSYTQEENTCHVANRHLVTTMRCRYCSEIQPIDDHCTKCSKIMGNYYCKICKLLDLESKGQFHCDKCGICRQGGVDKFDHCDKCGTCFPLGSKNHNCSIKLSGTCPICCDDLFNSVISPMKMRCGHWIHTLCFNSHIKYSTRCPLCSKRLFDENDSYNQMIEGVISSLQMPDEYRDKIVEILCNECNTKNMAKYHFYGHKCPNCSSYNTKIT